MRVQLFTCKRGSKTLQRLATALSDALGYKVWRTRKANLRRLQFFYGGVTNKLDQYLWFTEKGVSCPDFTTSQETARRWIEEGDSIMCRTLTRASEGRGIVIADTVDQLVSAPVYTKYIKKKREFRVHMFQDTIVGILEKRKRREFAGNRDARIRNTANGYVFCRELLEPLPTGLLQLAHAAALVTKSDFKGIDIGYNEHNDKLFVIEVNSAPGIEGSNINDYVNTILEKVNHG